MTPLEKIVGVPLDTMKAIQILKKFKVDITSGFGLYNSLSSAALGVPDITFGDSEPNINKISYSIQYKMFMPFVHCYVTPTSFKQHMGERHIKISSFKELAYLHPKYFIPEPEVIRNVDLRENEYAVLRFNSFDAVHDIGKHGFSDTEKIQVVRELEKQMKVVISSEKGVPQELSDRVMKFPRSKIHSILAFARILVCDTQTMATEAALLGTPVVRCNSFVGKGDMGNFVELEEKYGLIINRDSGKKALDAAIDVLKISNVKNEWSKRRDILLKEKIDIASFMTWLIVNYPDSYIEMKNNPVAQSRFL